MTSAPEPSAPADGAGAGAEATEQSAHRSDAANWAGKVERLEVEKRAGVRGTNVSGRRLAGPVQGFGKMWQKTFSVSGLSVTPEYAISEWRAHFSEFWPPGNRFAGSLTGISPGEVALLDLSVGGTKLSTGVLVLYVDERSFTFMTPQGHMFGGWITFSADKAPDGTRVEAQMLLRASDPIYEVALGLGGHRKEATFWRETLTSLAHHLGMENPVVEQSVVCVDSQRQWAKWRNVWYNSAVRSVGQTVSLRSRPKKVAESSEV